MNSKFAAHDINTHSLRSELVSRSQSGDKKASELLRALSKRTEENAGDLVVHYLRKAGSNSLETAMAGLGLVAFGLVALQPTMALYSLYLLRATLLGLLLVTFFLLVARYAHAPARWLAVGLGACLGLLHLLKGIVPLLAPLVLLAIVLAIRGRRATITSA